MEYMIESFLTVHDDILQRELSANADDKMKHIVTTIQREQNRIIRNNEADVLIIQGVAGSGKTSIALHRIAYLLYTLKGNISSKEILIISPNKVFADYISNVLPELGEENVPEIGMEQILSGVLDNKYKYQNYFEQITELLRGGSSGFYRTDTLQSLVRFYCATRSVYSLPGKSLFSSKRGRANRTDHGSCRIYRRTIQTFQPFPIRQRFEAMTDYIIERMYLQYNFKIAAAEKNRLKKEIKKMFAGNNDLQVYKDFFKWIGKPEMLKAGKNRQLEYTDLAPWPICTSPCPEIPLGTGSNIF